MRGRGLAAIHGVCGQADDKADAVLLDSYLSHIPGIGEESKFMQPLLWYIPLYAAFHYSHPPLAQRVARLLRMS